MIPSVLPAAPAGRGLTDSPEAPPRHRQVAGAVRIRRDPADAVPACRGLRHLGSGRRRSAPHHRRGAQPARGRPPAAGLDAAARAAGSVGAQRIPRQRRYRAVRHRPGGAADRADPRRRTHPDRSPAHRRRDRHARRVAAAPAAARRRRPDRPARARAVRGDRGVPSRPPTRSRRCAPSPARAACEVTLRAAQHLPWHPGPVRRGVRGRRPVVGLRRPAASRGRRARRACRRAPARSNSTSTRSRSRNRCRRRGCHRSRRCSRTSA